MSDGSLSSLHSPTDETVINLTERLTVRWRRAAESRFSLCSGRCSVSVVACPFRKYHPAWDSRREVESSHDWGRCLQSCTRSECSSSTYLSRHAGLKPRTCFF